MKTIADLIKEFPFFRDFPEKYHALIGACGKNCLVKKGEYIAHEGDPAEALFLLKRGRVAIEAYKPGEGSILVETLGPGEVIGWSWLVKPHRWKFDVRSLEDAHLIELDGKCLRKKSNADHELGHIFMTKMAAVMAQRLGATRMQLMDIYGKNLK